jgi:hypothetical protein
VTAPNGTTTTINNTLMLGSTNVGTELSKLANISVDGTNTILSGLFYINSTINVAQLLDDINNRAKESTVTLSNAIRNGAPTTISETLMLGTTNVGTTNVGTTLTGYDSRITANANKLANIFVDKTITYISGTLSVSNALIVGSVNVTNTLNDLYSRIYENTNKLANMTVNGTTTIVAGTLILGTSPATTNVRTTLTDYNSRVSANANKLVRVSVNGVTTTITGTLDT